MSFFNTDPFDFFRRFLGSSRGNIERAEGVGARQGGWNRRDFLENLKICKEKWRGCLKNSLEIFNQMLRKNW